MIARDGIKLGASHTTRAVRFFGTARLCPSRNGMRLAQRLALPKSCTGIRERRLAASAVAQKGTPIQGTRSVFASVIASTLAREN